MEWEAGPASAYARAADLALEAGEREWELLFARAAWLGAPDRADYRRALGSALVEAGNYDEAREHLLAILAVGDDAECWGLLGICHANLDEPEEAMRCYARAIRRKPQRTEPWYNRGLLHKRLGNLLAARRDLKRVLLIDPDDVDARIELGDLAEQQGRWAESARHYRAVLDRQPGDWETLGDLGRVLCESGRLPEAAEALETAIALAPRQAHLYNSLGICYKRGRRWDEALRCYERARRLDPGVLTYQVNEAIALREAGRDAEAITRLQRIVRGHPGCGAAWYELGTLREDIGNLGAARAAWILATACDDTEARRLALGALEATAAFAESASAVAASAPRTKTN